MLSLSMIKTKKKKNVEREMLSHVDMLVLLMCPLIILIPKWNFIQKTDGRISDVCKYPTPPQSLPL